jgi:hypothetical protein
MLGADGRPTTGIYTDEDSPSVDRAQYEYGRGPCLDAWRVKRVVRIDDMRQATDVHPEFARAALDHGTPSTLSLPLIAGSKGLGV